MKLIEVHVKQDGNRVLINPKMILSVHAGKVRIKAEEDDPEADPTNGTKLVEATQIMLIGDMGFAVRESMEQVSGMLLDDDDDLTVVLP
jgi:hypothetical protein